MYISCSLNINNMHSNVQTTKDQSWSRGIDCSFLNLRTRWGWAVNTTPLPLYRPQEPVPVYIRLGGPQGRLDGCGKSSHTGIGSSDKWDFT
jgi:hypothetical protein